MEFQRAIEDCDTSIKKDPKFGKFKGRRENNVNQWFTIK
jgi:hypothetical protein